MQNMQRVRSAYPVRTGSRGTYAQTRGQNETLSERREEAQAEARQENACRGDCLDGMPSLAMVYAPCQAFVDLYELDEGLRCGTIFRALNMPFRPGYGKRGGER